jgi:outer membrane lipoprotein-sorting protein
MGDIPVELIASEYKSFGGILEPVKVTQKTGPQEFTITLESVEANPAIPASRFEMPPEVRQLADKAASK